MVQGDSYILFGASLVSLFPKPKVSKLTLKEVPNVSSKELDCCSCRDFGLAYVYCGCPSVTARIRRYSMLFTDPLFFAFQPGNRYFWI
jgi:hypothetical protein